MSGKVALVFGIAGLVLCAQLSLADDPPPIHQVGNLQIEKLKGLTSYMVMIGPADRAKNHAHEVVHVQCSGHDPDFQ